MIVLIFTTLFCVLVVFWICLQLYRIKPKNKIPFPPQNLNNYSQKSDSEKIIEMYEYIKTRAYTLENVEISNPKEAIPLWVNLDEIYNILLLHKDGDLPNFLREVWNSEYYSYGFDVDDFEVPEMRSDQELRLKTIEDAGEILKSFQKND